MRGAGPVEPTLDFYIFMISFLSSIPMLIFILYLTCLFYFSFIYHCAFFILHIHPFIVHLYFSFPISVVHLIEAPAQRGAICACDSKQRKGASPPGAPPGGPRPPPGGAAPPRLTQ